jgi:hypothetical protein
MTSDIIVPFVEERPFTPFEIYLADGRVLRVPHSDHVTMERFAVALVVYDDEGFRQIVDIGLIVSIRLLRQAT